MSHIARLSRKYAPAFVGATVLVASSAMAAAPAEITDGVDSLTLGFTAIKGLIVTVVTFGLVIGYLKMLRKK